MKQTLCATLLAVVAYVIVSSLLHYAIFPEPGPEFSDLPLRGTTIANRGIRSRFVYRQTSIETSGQIFQWDNFVDPGGGPINTPHVHPHLREIFEVVDGEMRFVINGQELLIKGGEQITAEPGDVHAFQNASLEPVHMVSRFEPSEAGPWEELARAGLLMDSQFVQFERSGGIGGVSKLQRIVFGSRFKQLYLAGSPIWVQQAVSFLVAPTARIFGYHAYYPPRDDRR